MYSTTSADIKTRNNGHFHASSAVSGLERIDLVAQGVVKELKAQRARFTIDSEPTQLSQDVRVLSPPCPVFAFSPPSRILYSTQHNKSSERVSTTTNTFQYPTISSSSKKVNTTISVCARPRPVMATETPKGDNESRKVHGKVANKSAIQDHQVDEKAPEGEYLSPIGDDKADVNLTGDVHFINDLQSRGQYQKRLLKETIETTRQIALYIYLSRFTRGI